MYTIIFSNGHDNIVVIEKAEKIEIHENETDIKTIYNNITNERFGCWDYYIFDKEIDLKNGDVINQELKDQSIDIKQFIMVTEPKSLTAMQEYIKSLEEKLEAGT